MITRRKFIAQGVLAGAAVAVSSPGYGLLAKQERVNFPIVISTWRHGVPANEAAWEVLKQGGYALDAVEAGVRVAEADPLVITVGKGGIPDASGKVTLDACIMDEKGRAGSVCYLKHIVHPISVARMIMEKTPHVMLCGKGALDFALKNGFNKAKLLTRERKKAWKEWKKHNRVFKNHINTINTNKELHDTISMLAIDKNGRLSGACTTSGLGYKLPGRVGDSPIIGAGLFVDGEVGAAAATGTGELVMKTLGSFLVVELMKSGLSPRQACREAVLRIVKKIPEYENHQVGYIALNSKGEYGAFSLQPGFEYAVKNSHIDELTEAEAWLKKL